MDEPNTLTELTAEIAASFVSNNHVAIGDIGGMISSIHATLAGLGKALEPEAPAFVAAVTIRKSLANPAKIISMIDGKPYSLLKRHLTTNGLTPAEYRARYNLPADYPMTAPAYSEQRKAMAVKIGLGRKPGEKRAPAKKAVGRPKGIAAAKKAAVAHLSGETAE
jgi:predicted transcriptional regulator